MRLSLYKWCLSQSLAIRHCRGYIYAQRREWNLAVLQGAPRARRVVEKNISLLDCAGGVNGDRERKGKRTAAGYCIFMPRGSL